MHHETIPDKTHLRSWPGYVLFAAVILLLLGYLAVYVVYAVELMQFPFDYDQGEGFELVDTVMLSEGHWPYRNNETYPYYASNYPPLFHVILVPFVWVFDPAYWYGRLVGFAGTLVSALAIGAIVNREGHHRPIAVISGLAFLASNYVYHVGPLFRQHMTMVMFEILSVLVLAYAVTLEDKRRHRRAMIGGLLLLLAAGYTKQLALATVIAVFVFLFIRSPRRAIAWGAVFGAAAGIIFLWIDVSTQGEWWKNIIAANVNEYYFVQFQDLFEQWFRLHWVLVVMAALFVVYELYFDRLSLYSIWWGAAVGNSVLSGKWGAGDSYFATAIAASCVLSGLFAARTLRAAWSFPPDHPYVRPLSPLRGFFAAHRSQLTAAAGVIIPAAYLLYAVSVLHLPTEGAVFGRLADWLGLESSYGDRYAFYDSAGWVPGYATIGHLPTRQDRDNGWQIVDIIKASEKPVLSEEAGFSLRADKDVVTNPTQLKNLYENDLFDPTNLVTAIQAHDFGAIIFRAQFYPPPVLEAVYTAYYPSQVIRMNGFDYEIWRPGPPASEGAALAVALADASDLQGELVLSLPLDEARRWLGHTMTHQGWVASDSLSPTENQVCEKQTFHNAEESVQIHLCPEGAQTFLLVITKGRVS